MVHGQCLMDNGEWSVVTCHRSKVIGQLWPIICGQLSGLNFHLCMVIGQWSLVTGHQLLVTGHKTSQFWKKSMDYCPCFFLKMAQNSPHFYYSF